MDAVLLQTRWHEDEIHELSPRLYRGLLKGSGINLSSKSKESLTWCFSSQPLHSDEKSFPANVCTESKRQIKVEMSLIWLHLLPNRLISRTLSSSSSAFLSFVFVAAFFAFFVGRFALGSFSSKSLSSSPSPDISSFFAELRSLFFLAFTSFGSELWSESLWSSAIDVEAWYVKNSGRRVSLADLLIGVECRGIGSASYELSCHDCLWDEGRYNRNTVSCKNNWKQ